MTLEHLFNLLAVLSLFALPFLGAAVLARRRMEQRLKAAETEGRIHRNYNREISECYSTSH